MNKFTQQELDYIVKYKDDSFWPAPDDVGKYPIEYNKDKMTPFQSLHKRNLIRWRSSGYYFVGDAFYVFKGIELSKLLGTAISVCHR